MSLRFLFLLATGVDGGFLENMGLNPLERAPPNGRAMSELDICDEAAWPDKDHGLVCGECKVLVDQFSSKYPTCNDYCTAVGRICTGAWEEEGDTCTVMNSVTMDCSTELASSDAICECLDSTDKCDEEAWPDKDHDLVCGECKVLVNQFASLYPTCHDYCAAVGRA